MTLTQSQWNTERAKLVTAQAEIQSAIDEIDAIFNPPPSGVTWDLTGVAGAPTISNGNRTVAATGAHVLRSSVSRTASRRWGQVLINAPGNSGYLGVGVIRSDQSISTPPTSLAAVPAGMWLLRSDGYVANNGSSSLLSGASFGANDRIEPVWDETGRLWFRKNGVLIQGDPGAGTGPIFTGLAGSLGICVAFFGANGSPVVTSYFDDPTGTAPATFDLLGV
jgi:hypothetical protein